MTRPRYPSQASAIASGTASVPDVSRFPAIPRPASSAPDGGADMHTLFVELAAVNPYEASWHTLREELVRRNLPLVHYLVRRFAGRGEPLDDLTQVATIGLIKAIDRFDATRGVEFSTYATPTVLGEIRRHFRDRGWAVRVPRRIQEHVLAVTRASSELFSELSRAPTVPELAVRTGLSEEEVLEAIDSSRAYTTVSLDAEFDHPVAGRSSHHLPAGDAEIALEGVENRAALRPLLNRLDGRERQIILLRFFANLTQSEIAAAVGISQMHVSRLLSRSLTKLRAGLDPR